MTLQDLKTPPATYFIKKAAGITSGSTKPGHTMVGTVSLKHLYEIAKEKQKDLPMLRLEAIVDNLRGTCKSMGVAVVSRPEDAL